MSYDALGILNRRTKFPSMSVSYTSRSASIVALTFSLLCAQSQKRFLYVSICCLLRPSGMNIPFFSFIPNTMIPPFVLANAENVSQKLSSNPPFADLNSTSEFSEPLINSFICLFMSDVIFALIIIFYTLDEAMS